MALRQIQPSREELDATLSRFGIAQDAPQVDPDTRANQLQLQSDIRSAVVKAASDIVRLTEPSREQSLALTALEEALVWAGKAVFK